MRAGSAPSSPARACDVAEGGERVVDRGREPVLGREAVVDGQHARARRRGEQAGGRVVGVEVADHPAAAVEEDQQRRGIRPARLLGHVEPRAQRSVGARDGEPLHARRAARGGPATTRELWAVSARACAGDRVESPRPPLRSSRRRSSCVSRSSSSPSRRIGAPARRRLARGGSAAAARAVRNSARWRVVSGWGTSIARAYGGARPAPPGAGAGRHRPLAAPAPAAPMSSAVPGLRTRSSAGRAASTIGAQTSTIPTAQISV